MGREGEGSGEEGRGEEDKRRKRQWRSDRPSVYNVTVTTHLGVSLGCSHRSHEQTRGSSSTSSSQRVQ